MGQKVNRPESQKNTQFEDVRNNNLGLLKSAIILYFQNLQTSMSFRLCLEN